MAPPNNNLANATVLTGTSGSVEGTTLLATRDTPYDPLYDEFIAGPQTVWYKLAVPGSWVANQTTLAIRIIQHSTISWDGGAAVLDIFEATTYPPTSSGDWNDLASGNMFAGDSLLTYKGATPAGGIWFYLGVGCQLDDSTSATDFTMSWSFADTAQGIAVAFDAATLAVDPFFTQLDDNAFFRDLSVQEWSIDRGRSSEQDRMDTGKATIKIKDTAGILDPTNTFGPFYGQLNPMKQASISLRNPVDDTYTMIFRGFVSEWLYEMDITGTFAEVTLELADAFDFLSSVEMTPGNQGDTGPAGTDGDIFFAGGIPPGGIDVSTFKHVDQRIEQALDDVGWPSSLRDIFSGNVTVQGKVYARRDNLMNVLQDAADAEFPGVANIYMSKDGVFTFHGRFARFNPTNPGYGITTWKAGDLTAFAGDSTTAVISPLAFRRSKNDIINNAVALPDGVDETDVPGAVVKDTTSITAYGWHSPGTFDALITYQGHDDDGNTVDAVTETKKFATYYVDNYKNPFTRVSQVQFRPHDPNSAIGEAVWPLLCGIELNDRILLTTTHPGGGGFNFVYFFVEGLHYQVDTQGGANFDNVTLDVDISPASLFSNNPFGNVDDGVTPQFTPQAFGGTTVTATLIKV